MLAEPQPQAKTLQETINEALDNRFDALEKMMMQENVYFPFETRLAQLLAQERGALSERLKNYLDGYPPDLDIASPQHGQLQDLLTTYLRENQEEAQISGCEEQILLLDAYEVLHEGFQDVLTPKLESLHAKAHKSITSTTSTMSTTIFTTMSTIQRLTQALVSSLTHSNSGLLASALGPKDLANNKDALRLDVAHAWVDLRRVVRQSLRWSTIDPCSRQRVLRCVRSFVEESRTLSIPVDLRDIGTGTPTPEHKELALSEFFFTALL